MNRQQRRKLERQRTVVGGHVLAGQGTTHKAVPHAQLPAKQPGRHRWIGMAAYVLDDERAALGFAEGNRVVLRPADLWEFGVSCIDCEQPYPLVEDRPCPAPAYVAGGGG